MIAVIALVFAMMGGAYAANNSSDGGDATASAKKKPKPKPGPPGKPGKQGPAGPAGPAGAKGDKGDSGANGTNGIDGLDGLDGLDGEDGTDGTNGVNGKTVLNGTTTPGAGTGVNGDFYIETDVNKIYGPKAATGTNGGWGDGVDLKGPAGDPGFPWVVGTAPEGVVMKGTWAIQQYTAAAANEEIPVPITTSVPINTSPGGLNIASGASYIPPGSPADPDQFVGCTGTAENPTITLKETAPGVFNDGVVCIYASAATNLKFPNALGGIHLGTSGAGFVPLFRANAAGLVAARGTWVLITPIAN